MALLVVVRFGGSYAASQVGVEYRGAILLVRFLISVVCYSVQLLMTPASLIATCRPLRNELRRRFKRFLP